MTLLPASPKATRALFKALTYVEHALGVAAEVVHDSWCLKLRAQHALQLPMMHPNSTIAWFFVYDGAIAMPFSTRGRTFWITQYPTTSNWGVSAHLEVRDDLRHALRACVRAYANGGNDVLEVATVAQDFLRTVHVKSRRFRPCWGPGGTMHIPTALPAEPTAQIIWETIDDATVKITFEEPRSSDDGTSDGIPTLMPVERSTTVAVVVHDLQLALDVLVELARRDRIPIDVLPLWRAQDQTTPVGYDPMTLTGTERVATDLEAVSLNILDWRKFKNWIHAAVVEAEGRLFQLFDARKASAVVFRLRTLANEVRRRHPPNDLNHAALRLG